MRKLAVFSLSAVLRYEYATFQRFAQMSIEKVEGEPFSLAPADGEKNIQQLLLETYRLHKQEQPSAAKLKKIEKQFSKYLKKYFVQEEDSFEVRPGVQNIFNHIEKRKNWKYCILSPYWNKATHQVLESCGVYSKNKFTITANQALTAQEQLEIAMARTKKKNKGLKVFLVNENLNIELNEPFELIQPKGSKSAPNYFIYPKFSELFKAHL